jgi:hypothetical protein
VAPVQSQEMNPILRQDEHETLETLFQNVDLNLAETQARARTHYIKKLLVAFVYVE